MLFSSRIFLEDPITGVQSSTALLVMETRSILLVSPPFDRLKCTSFSFETYFANSLDSLYTAQHSSRSPVSVYMRYDAVQNFTYYIISASESEECVTSFKNLLNLVSHDSTDNNLKRVLLQHPLEPHILLSKILCESSQPLINFFRQSMFAQVLIFYIYSPSNAENKLAATSSGRALRSKDRQP